MAGNGRLNLNPKWPFWAKPPAAQAPATGATQIGYRFRNDDGNETTATWRQAANTPDKLLTDTTFRLRFEVENQSSVVRTVGGQLEVSTDNVNWSSVTTSSTVVKAIATANVTDNTASTDQLSGSSRTFVAGSVSADGLATSVGITNAHTEIEYVLRVNSAAVVDQQPLWFRIAGLSTYTVTAQAIVSEAVIPFADTFDSGTAPDFLPTGWVQEAAPGVGTTTQTWFTRDAPSWGAGRVASGKLLADTSHLLSRAFSNTAGNGSVIRLIVGTDQSPINTSRVGEYFFYSGTSVAFSILFMSDGKIYANNMATAAKVLLTGYAPNTKYDIKIFIGASGAITSANVNGTVTSAVGTMNNSITAINTIRCDTYNGTLGELGHAILDAVTVDTSTAVPNGTLASSGTLDGTTLGPDLYGGIRLGYTNGVSPAAGIYKVERSANGTTWAEIDAGRVKTASGFLITDARPQYGGQPVAVGNTASYRVTALNSSGDQLTSTVTATPAAANTSAIDTARFSMLHGLISAQPGGFYPTDTAGESYPTYWLAAMAYAYLQTGTTAYKTDAVNEFNYLVSQTNADGLWVYAPDTTLIYRDHHFRAILYTALAARLLRRAGDSATAATLIAQCDTWAAAWLAKVNSGSPYTSTTVHGWDNGNATNPPQWTGSTSTPVGYRTRTSPTSNGHVYEAQTSGVTAGSQPTWPTGAGSTVQDGDILWKEVSSNLVRANSTAYTLGQIVIPATPNGRTYRCIVAGTTAASPPTWPTAVQSTVTDGGVTWRCTSYTGSISSSTYTNNGSTYPAAVAADVDVNQVTEEAAAWALLTTDPASAYSIAGAGKTAAEARITAITGVITAYQASDGKVPIGDPIGPNDGRAMYDTLYGGFSAATLAIIWYLRPDVSHPDTGLMTSTALDWFDSALSTEPLKYVHYTGLTFGLSSAEFDFRRTAYDLMGRTNPLQNLWYSGAFNFGTDFTWGYYVDSGPPMAEPFGGPWQARMLIGDATSAALVLTSKTGSDSGTGTDTGTVSATVPGSDSGTGTESGTVGETGSGSDTGTGSESGSIVVTLSGAESATGTEGTPTLTATVSSSDSATGTESGVVGDTTGSGDSGAGSDSGSVSVTLSSSDTGAGSETDSLNTSQQITGSDSATGTEGTPTVSVTASGSQAATGTDTGTVSATASSSDTSTGTDTGSNAATVPGSDSGTGSESGVVGDTTGAGDSGSGAEGGTVNATATGADSGVGTDAGSVSDITGGPTTLSGSDSGTGTDSGSVVNLTPPVDTGPTGGADYGDESAIYGEPPRHLSDSDAGEGSDSGRVVDLTPRPVPRPARLILPQRRTASLKAAADLARTQEASRVLVASGAYDRALASESAQVVDITPEDPEEIFMVMSLLFD